MAGMLKCSLLPGAGAATPVVLPKLRLSRKTEDKPELTQAKPPKRPRPVGPVHDEAVRHLVELLCDVDMMRTQVEEVGYDAHTAPLANLNREKVREGLTWLNAIQRELQKPVANPTSLEMLSGSFFKAITCLDEDLIDTLGKVQERANVLRTLLEIDLVYNRLLRLASGRGHKRVSEDGVEEDLRPQERETRNELLDLQAQLAALKRPRTAYFTWFCEHREELVADLGKGAGVCAIAQKGGERWRALTDEERQPYEDRYRAEKEAHDNEQRALREQHLQAAEQADPLVQRQYRMLMSDLEPIPEDSGTWQLISTMVALSGNAVQGAPRVRIVRVFTIDRPVEEKAFAKHATKPNRKLLWYGARLSCWAGILSNGLRPLPPEAPSEGCPFGKGLYFTDLASRAAQQCLPGSGGDRQVLLLAEVAMGTSLEKVQPAGVKATKLPAGHHSIFGRGLLGPDPKGHLPVPNGASVALGPVVTHNVPGGTLPYNEFVVYNASQVRMRYLVEVSLA